MTVVGADPDALDRVADSVRRGSDVLTRIAADGRFAFDHSTWNGPDAELCRHEFATGVEPAILTVAEFTRHLAAELAAHAAEQRAVSRPDGHRLGGGAVAPRLPRTRFDAPPDGRAAALAALAALDGGGIRRDEIELRRLDNGRYVVVLPGVTDLTEGVTAWPPWEWGPFHWLTNDEDTVRKTRYAYEAVRADDTDVNEYSVAVMLALREAGVPAGADIAIVGHSFGAYAAVDLAVGNEFGNGVGVRLDDYRVNVTHVIAAAAETDWRFDEVPSDVRVMVLNNERDLVRQVEEVHHRDERPVNRNQVEHDFFGGFDGLGHDESNYLAELARTDRDAVLTWLDDFGTYYADGGDTDHLRVPDPGQRGSTRSW